MTTRSSEDERVKAGAALEQYKLAVEMADRLSGRRQSANSFFLSVVSALTVANGTGIVSEWYWTCIVSIVTVLVCFMWWRLLASYRAINSAKVQGDTSDRIERCHIRCSLTKKRYTSQLSEQATSH